MTLPKHAYSAVNTVSIPPSRHTATRPRRYNDEGFVIGGAQYPGPVLCYQSLVLRWNDVKHVRDVTFESLATALLLKPRPELILLGTGGRLQRLDPAVRQVPPARPSRLDPSSQSFHTTAHQTPSSPCCLLPPRPVSAACPPRVRVSAQRLVDSGILVECIDTRNAVAMFSVLQQEGRNVMGAMLPVSYV